MNEFLVEMLNLPQLSEVLYFSKKSNGFFLENVNACNLRGKNVYKSISKQIIVTFIFTLLSFFVIDYAGYYCALHFSYSISQIFRIIIRILIGVYVFLSLFLYRKMKILKFEKCLSQKALALKNSISNLEQQIIDSASLTDVEKYQYLAKLDVYFPSQKNKQTRLQWLYKYVDSADYTFNLETDTLIIDKATYSSVFVDYIRKVYKINRYCIGIETREYLERHNIVL